ncbi:hypothetical protein N309_12036, partial [Tinamus guttatus]
SPTICHMTVARMLQLIRQRNPDILIYSYMDDILIRGSSLKAVEQVSERIRSAVIVAGLQIVKEKVQQVSLWNYLGWRIRDGEIRPQQVKIGTGPIRTLNDLQRLLGAINWIRPVIGLTNEELRPLFLQLQGDPDLNSPQQLMEESQQALAEVAHEIDKRQSYRIQKELEIYFII